MTAKLVASRADDTHPSIVKYAEITGIAGNSIAEIDLFIDKDQLEIVQSSLCAAVGQSRAVMLEGGYTLNQLTELYKEILTNKGFVVDNKHLKNAILYTLSLSRVKVCHLQGANFTDEDSYCFALGKELPEPNTMIMLSVNTN